MYIHNLDKFYDDIFYEHHTRFKEHGISADRFAQYCHEVRHYAHRSYLITPMVNSIGHELIWDELGLYEEVRDDNTSMLRGLDQPYSTTGFLHDVELIINLYAIHQAIMTRGTTVQIHLQALTVNLGRNKFI